MKNLVFIFVFFLLIIPCSAEIIIVDQEWPYDFDNIQAAIDYSSNGDFIIVFPGTYTGEGNRDIDFRGKAITVRSIDPTDPCLVAQTIIDCNGTQAEPHRGFYFHNSEDGNSILDGLSIQNGFYTVFSGGIHCQNSSPKITNCIITNNNTMGRGGGISCEDSNPTITHCSIISNSAEMFDGGGIYCVEGSPIISYCRIIGNTANYGDGGGIYCIFSNLVITNSTISGNKVTEGGFENGGWGGGIYFSGESSSALTNCTITGNFAQNSGGGICCSDNNTTITGCSVTDNSADNLGGGILCSYSDPTITNCTIAGNSTDNHGGGIFCGRGNPIIKNCTISGNITKGQGGGIRFYYNSESVITNCIIWGNTAPAGAQIYYDEIFPFVSYCDVQNSYPGLGNIDIDPCFVNPGFWDSNGTTNDANDDFWVDGDYHLKSAGWRWDSMRHRWTYDDVTSRCIDAGNPGSSLGDELLSVPDDPNNEWGQNLRIDMGAFGGTAEASIPPYDWALLADLTNDGLVDLTDFAYQANDWLNSADQQPGDLNRDGLIDIDDLALLTDDWLAQTSWH